MTGTYWLILVCILCWLGEVPAAHITDQLLAGLYEEPSSGQKPIKLLASGTPVAVLEKRAGYQRIKLTDGTEGWVNASYVTDDKPAQVKLEEAQAQIAELKKQLAEAVAKARPTEGASLASGGNTRADCAAPAPLGQATRGSSPGVDCGTIEAELVGIEKRMAEAARLLGAPSEPSPVAPVSPVGSTSYWPLAVVAALLLGLALGMQLIRRRFAKRFGKGFRF
jgi:hypothetical protein